MADPLIFGTPALGITVSTVASKTIDNQLSAERKYPYASQNNIPVDDMHRHNQLVKRLDEDMRAITLSDLLDLPLYLLLPQRH